MDEMLVTILVMVIRLGVPLAVFRWPFWAGLACIAADASDTVIPEALDIDLFGGNYHNVDKVLDLYYLTIEAIVASRWADPLARWTALVLYSLRLLAVVLFEITGVRQLFFLLGPNIFENFYLWVAGSQFLDPQYRIRNRRRLALIILLVGLPKILQEYVMHYREAETWRFVKENVLLWR